ncbi:hypothetical protein ACFL3G_03150 [Planctomycetota bacterium]
MKDSKEYSKKIQSLYKTLKKKYAKPSKKLMHEQVIDAVICGIVSEHLNKKLVKAVIKRFKESFVDWNDLRVSLDEEVLDAIGRDNTESKKIVAALTISLNAVFNQYNSVDLEELKKTGKRLAKQELEKIDGLTGFVIDYVMLTALAGHAIPLTKKMLEYLKTNELVHPQADEQEVSGFLVRQIPAAKGYEFYELLRHQSEKKAKAGKKKGKAKKVVKKKTSKKAKKTKKPAPNAKTKAKKKNKKKTVKKKAKK